LLGTKAVTDLRHNHPCGDPTPSLADIQMTQAILEVTKSLGTAAHDHIVVGKNSYARFKRLREIQKSAVDLTAIYNIDLTMHKESNMSLRKFIIERDIPKVGTFERDQLRGAAAKSNGVLRQLGPDIQWQESFVAADKTFCVYLAKDEAIIHKHAEMSGFPATKITEIRKMIDPTTERAD
jgi:hypothetical protein